MRLLKVSLLLTFVLGVYGVKSFAAPQLDPKPKVISKPIGHADTEKPADVLKEETTQITYPKNYDPSLVPLDSKDLHREVLVEKGEPYNTLRHILSFEAASGFFIKKDPSVNTLTLDYAREIPRNFESSWEIGGGFSFQSIAQMHAAIRWPKSDDMYWKASLHNSVDASQMLAGLININHFKLRAHVGWDDINFLHLDSRFELSAGYGLTGGALSTALGFKF